MMPIQAGPLRFVGRRCTPADMLERPSVRGLAFLVAGIVGLLLAFAYIWLAGSAVVVDETGEVESAFITTGDGREQRLRHLWSGYFYAIPQLEGTIEVRCRDGQRKRLGYVTHYMDTKIRVVGETPCARLV
jgi:hypothetical protein